MRLDTNQETFLALVRAGLWEKESQLSQYKNINYATILQLAEEQSVVGLVTAGLEHVQDVKVPQEWVLQFVGETLQIEQHNKEMNAFVARLIDLLRKNDVYTILVKGQGIAQCYEKPFWRASGDVDLLLSDTNYKRAIEILKPLASSIDEEDEKRRHYAMTIDSWVVELHGLLHSGITRRIDKGVDRVQNDIFFGGCVRSWMNGNVSVFLPSANNDVIFIFTHILQHFFDGGIGLRQVCDWCRLLWTYRSEIDVNLLGKRLKKMGLMTEWKAFSALAVNNLGMPEASMPLYDKSSRYERKAGRILSLIFDTGNFGQGRDMSYKQNNTFFVRLAISFSRHTKDVFRQFMIFPYKALWMWMKMVVKGVRFAAKGE